MARHLDRRIYNRFYRQGPRVPVIWQNIGLGLLVVIVLGIAAALFL